MDQPAEKKARAWQPLTPKGVAAFGAASLGRLLTAQFVVALLAAAAILWFLNNTWFRSIREAITKLPDTGEIRSAGLHWPGPSSLRLAESRFLALSVDLQHTGEVRSPAHVQIEFGSTTVRVNSLFGYLLFDYPRGYVIAFNRTQLQPWWGAWSPALLALTGLGVVGGLLCIWGVLAWLYSPVVWLVAFYGNRNLSWKQSRRVAGAALLPAALFLIIALVVYGLGGLDLVKLLAVVAAHFFIGWAYLVASPLALRRDPKLGPGKGNPFARRAEKQAG